MTSISIIILCFFCGLVSAGIVKNTYQLITTQEINFDLPNNAGPVFWTKLLVYVFAGPLIIIKNALELRRQYNVANIWLLLSGFIVFAWCFVIGLTILGFIVSFI